ncbi:hypothetical protein GCM10028791_21580 [Echinicola sediminis]
MLASNALAQEAKPFVESFESGIVLENYHSSESSELQLSDEHRRFGHKSLKWKWSKAGSSFRTAYFEELKSDTENLTYNSLFPSSPTFIFSIYNEQPQEGNLKIAFFKEDEACVWFSVGLDFSGWRTMRVPFYEMEGDAPEKVVQVDYDSVELISDAPSGTLYFDDVIFSQYQDDRFQYPDVMVPFIKSDQDHSVDHWMPLMANLEMMESLKVEELSEGEMKSLEVIQQRINEEVFPKKKTVDDDLVEKEFARLGIIDRNGNVLGPPLTYLQREYYYDSLQQGPKIHHDISDFGKVIKHLAEDYLLTSDVQNGHSKKYKQMFLLASRYYLDQGWQKGSSGGSRHHVGYATRELTEAFYLMRGPLAEEGLLEPVGESLQWLTNLGMILGEEKDFLVNIDYLNTQSYYHLLQLFLAESPEKRVALLKAYSNYLNVILGQQDKEWGFKADGTAWHHSGHYPAYAIGAFSQVPKIVYSLSGTPFQVGKEGHVNFKKAFLTTAEYSQRYDWGFW